MQANIWLTLHNVPDRVMEKSEVEVFTETTLGFLQKYTEQTLILEMINVWHQQLVEVDVANPGVLSNEFNAGPSETSLTDDFIANITEGSIVNTTQGVNATGSSDNITDTSAGGFADFSSENAAGGFADFKNDDSADEMAGGFADFGNENDSGVDEDDSADEMTGGFAGLGNENDSGGFVSVITAGEVPGEFAELSTESDEMAGGFAEFDSEETTNELAGSFVNMGQRKIKAGGGAGKGSVGLNKLDQEKLDKIIAFKQKHSDRGPKTSGVQVTLILLIPFAYLPEDLLAKFASVIVQEHGVELVRSLRMQSSFYSYFKELTGVTSDTVEELTMPPTNMPTTHVHSLTLQKEEQALTMETNGSSFATVSLCD
jgi:hypothetical protein